MLRLIFRIWRSETGLDEARRPGELGLIAPLAFEGLYRNKSGIAKEPDGDIAGWVKTPFGYGDTINRMGDENTSFRPDIASTARMYDYYLGGKDNYPVDREAAEKVIKMMPSGTVRTAVIQNRKFIGRAVRYLAGEMNIRQFLDIGTGLPTMNNVHEVAQSVDAACRVVYVDHDPVVLAHAREMLDGVENTTIVGHDLREPSAIIGDPEVRDLLDFGEPAALLLVAVLHFISDDEKPRELIRALMEPMTAGSYLVISHVTADSFAQWNGATQVYEKATSQLSNRTHAEVAALFEGFDLVEPGIVWLPEWHPDADTGMADNAGGSLGWCGVARKAG